MDPPISLNIAYLSNAAHILHTSAPETSMHLMKCRNELARFYEIGLPDQERLHTCVGCGEIFVAGQGAKLTLKSGRALGTFNQRRAPRARRFGQIEKRAPRESAMLKHPRGLARKTVECGQCHQSTYFVQLRPSARPRRKTLKKAAAEPKSTTNKSLPNTTSTPIQHAPSSVSGDRGENSQSRPSPVLPTTTPKSTTNANSKKRAKQRKAGLQALLSQAQSSQASRNLGLNDFRRK